ncbi:MAG: c-type cytochrome, partial [Acidobacteria bacterium]|nr:c-type cytochrome [Acidobacteriota bacterium]
MTAIAKTILLLSTCLALSLRAEVRGAGAYFLSGDTKAGMRAFFDKGCARCHAVLGEGGRAAPDLARAPAGHLSAAELVAAMWNHAPAMWDKMRVQHVAPPKFDETEMTNLFAFLYSVRALDEPGDAERGRRLLSEKKCLECHAVAGQGGRTGPDLRKWAAYRNPVSWIQAMWNHAQPMQAMMSQRGVSWPQFGGNDMADLMAYVRTLAPNPRGHVYLRHADAEAGRQLFRQKGCVACHAIRGAGGGRGPDLGTRALPRTLGQFAGLMWNHAPAMWASMRAQQLPRPQFSNQEMADLIAYLFAERYFEATGNTDRGKRRFEEKGCAGCHATGNKALGPNLTGWKGGGSPIPVATALWNHGPLMLEKMKEQQVPWPRFRPGEIVDLMEFLNRGA